MHIKLRKLSQQLATAGIKHVVVEAMAVRPYTYEAPILKDVREMAQAIRRSLKNVPANYVHKGYLRRKPVYEAMLSELGVPKEVMSRYPDLCVTIAPGTDASQGYFSPTLNTIQLTYSQAMVDATIVDYRPVFRGLDVVIEHELRHYVDYSSGLHKAAMHEIKDGIKDSSYTGYYSQEHEIDARLTSLFLKVNTLFKGSALLALNNKVDTMTKEHRALLLNFNAFWLWLLKYDRKLSIESIAERHLTREAMIETEGKSKEFWKFMREEYGMAFRIVKADEVTPAQKKAWIALHREVNKTNQEATNKIKKIATASCKETE